VVDFQYDFEDEVWYEISDGAKDLVQKLLSPADQRLTAKEALLHPWLVNLTRHGDYQLSTDLLSRMKSFSSVSKMQQIALNMMAHQCTSDEIQEMKDIFQSIDINNDGYITLKELKECLKGKFDER